MNISTVVVGEFEVNCYLCFNQDSKEGVIIDPGADAQIIIKEIENIGFEPKAILLTHGHVDHIGGVTEVKKHFNNIPLYAGVGEEKLLENPASNLSAAMGIDFSISPAEYWISDEQLIQPAGINFRVLATPGHSPGGVCFLDEAGNNLFCGDTLFYGSIGRTDFPGCSHQLLIDSINKKILTLPDSIICYPGHGPETTVGAERVNNPFLRGENFV